MHSVKRCIQRLRSYNILLRPSLPTCFSCRSLRLLDLYMTPQSSLKASLLRGLRPTDSLRRFACPLVQLAQLSCNARDKSSASVAYNPSGRAPSRAFVQRFILLSKGARHRRKYRFLAHCIFQFHRCSFVLSVLFSNLYIRILLFLFRFRFTYLFFTKKIAIVLLAAITRKTMIIVAVRTCSCASPH